MEEGKKHDIEFLKTREEATETFATPEEPFDLIAPAVQGFVIRPGCQTIALGRDHRNPAEIQGQLAGRVVLVSAVPDEIEWCRQRSNTAQKCAALHRVGSFSRGEREGSGRASLRGNQMNLGAPSTARVADRLGSVLFNAPVPSGWTLTMVESSDTASSLLRTTCSGCHFSKRRSSTPLFAQRFMRV